MTNVRTPIPVRSRLVWAAVVSILAVWGLQSTAEPAAAVSLCSTENCGTVTVTVAAPATATTTGSSTLTVTTSGTGSGSVGVDSSPCVAFPCITQEPYGTVVGLSVAPAGNSVFDGWTGACAGQGTTCFLSMTADQATSARFDLPATATPAPATGKPTATPEPSPGGGSPTTSGEGATAGPTSSETLTPAGLSTPSPAASADPGAPAAGDSGNPPWLPIGAFVLAAMAAALVGAFQLGARRRRA